MSDSLANQGGVFGGMADAEFAKLRKAVSGVDAKADAALAQAERLEGGMVDIISRLDRLESDPVVVEPVEPSPQPSPSNPLLQPRETVTWESIKPAFVDGATIKNVAIDGGIQLVGKNKPRDIKLENVECFNAPILFNLNSTDHRATGWRINGLKCHGATADSGYSDGIYLGRVDDFEMSYLDLDRNGHWTDGRSWAENHGVYISTSGIVKIRKSVIKDSAGQGIKAKGCGSLLVEDTDIIGGLIGIGGDDRFDSPETILRRVRFIDQGGEDSSGRSYAQPINFVYDKDSNTGRVGYLALESVVIAGPAQRDYNSPVRAINITGRIDGLVTFFNCDLTGWTGGAPSVNVLGDNVAYADNKGF